MNATSPTPTAGPGDGRSRPVPAGRVAGEHRTVVAVSPETLTTTAGALLAGGFRLALVAAHDDRAPGTDAGFRAVYLFTASAPDRRIELHVLLDADKPAVPSLAALSFPGGRFEREMLDLFGIAPAGHPQPLRLVRHYHWPQGWHPMRSDAGPRPEFAEPEGPYPFLEVEGPGVYEIPVGPVHAGLIEPGHFRFSVVGETIIKLKARLWFVHRGIEKLFEGRTPEDSVKFAERVSGDTAVGHTLAYAQAVEDAVGCRVPRQARAARALLLEMERLHNHTADLGALANDVGHSILNAHAQRIREQLLRLNADVTGHRLLRGGVAVGGARLRAVPDPAALAAIGADLGQVVDLALGHTVVRDRFTGTAVLTVDAARDLGTLGVVARASGLGADARRDHPAADYPESMTVPVHTTGDVLARFLVRAEEIQTSLRLIEHFGSRLTPGTWHTDLPAGRTGPATGGVGIVEGWRGTIVHRVELDADGRLTRARIVDPSFFNWPALPVALHDTIVPDFPLANKSFNLSYAGNDL